MNRFSALYLLGYTILFILMVYLMLSYPKAELHLLLNSNHTPCQDSFFHYYSVLAEWPLYVIALVPVFFGRWRWTCFYAVAEISSALIVQIVKFCHPLLRPVSFFAKWYPDVQLPLVSGVTIHHNASFPSGHSSTFFVFFTFSVMLLSQYYLSHQRKSLYLLSSCWRMFLVLFLLLFATLGGYSRIYLSQHFLMDVCVGSLCGVVSSCVVFLFFQERITNSNEA